MQEIDQLSPKEYILIKGASVHNLKKVDVAINRNSFTVITGLSGSGKSSLAFDTLYAEGQRRYVESLSSYARQFMGRLDKPDVEYIKGIAPAIAIEQKVNTRNPRSTVGTSTEIYDYLKLLFARIGKTYAPLSGKLVKKHSVSDVVDFLLKQTPGNRYLILSPLHFHTGRNLSEELQVLLQKGFSRINLNKETIRIDDYLHQIKEAEPKPVKTKGRKKKTEETDNIPHPEIFVVIDRLVIPDNWNDEMQSSLADSIQIAFNESNGYCIVANVTEDLFQTHRFSSYFEEDGIRFEEPSTLLFSFNNPYGACKNCEGYGSVIGIDENLVVPNKSLSVFDGAIACWRGEKMNEWQQDFILKAYKFNFPVHRPYYELNEVDKKLLWEGNKTIQGINDFFKYVESQTFKIQYRVMLSRYRGKTTCPECKGTRLRKDATYVKINNQSITNIVLMPVNQSLEFFSHLMLDDYEMKVAGRILIEIKNRLQYLHDVGLGYLTLNRLSNTLSGGESQRINLATSLGSSLVGSMYILDEPSIGLHPRDTQKLIHVLKSLQKAGNTLIVVEHDEEIMRNADSIIDIGPMAGTHGGKIIFQGNFNQLEHNNESITARYLTGKEIIHVPSKRRTWTNSVELFGVRENNLQNINAKIPLGVLTAVTGVSGSGKSTLVKKVLYPALKKVLGGYDEESGHYERITGDFITLRDVEIIDQDPIGKSSRSNPVTYIKAYDEIRALLAETPFARQKMMKPSLFSFNVDGGRCDMCLGEGVVTIEMQFMADIQLKCESCNGKRFKNEILAITYREKNVYDLLNMTVDDAIKFFNAETDERYLHFTTKINAKLQPLADVGLGYISLGQASSTLSGGEAQRIKLASYLSLGNATSKTLFIFDEPTTGLHFHDIRKLLDAFSALIRNGNSILVIEHNLDVIKCADWVIDIGPGGGEDGGQIVFSGTPEQLVECENSVTGAYLKSKLTHHFE
jgi:excinuclease ABC subunit A